MNEQGDFVKGADGRVEVRYKAGESKPYRAADRNLEPLGTGDDALLPDDACSSEGAAPGASTEARGKRDKKSAAAARVADQKHPESTIIVYADGACSGNPGPAGIGVVVQDGGTRRELSMYIGQGTNNVAELTALMEAAQIIEQPERPVRMHTDSKYAIGVLSLGWKAKANQDLVARVKQALARLEDLKLIHVPGHAGVVLNERADTLAVQAVKSESTTGWVTYEGKAG